jgi:membrane-associated phospholipid phosphatase
MIGFLQKTKVFSIPFLVLVGGLSLLLLFYTKVEIELWVNAHNSPFLDDFFRFFTNVGDGLAAILISLAFILFNARKGIILLTGYLLSGLIIQLLKIFVFPDVLRPVALIGQSYPLHLVAGVKILTEHSFPSGHAGTAFALFFCLAAFTDNKGLQFLALLTSVAIAFSRMYLSQHFLTDVIAGAVIGTFTSLILLAWFEQKNLLRNLDRPLFPIHRKYAEQNN